ncbi:MAG: 3-hydroxybenzoate 6-monooxygenase [Pseudomonadota bacterium]
MRPSVIIAGGGIGGLSTALSLARKNILSVVLERSPQFSEIGAGIQLGPNAFSCFDQMGIGQTARKMAVFIDALRLMNAMDGSEIVQVPLGESFRSRFNNPYAVVHRGDLHKVLLDACKSDDRICLRTNAQVTRYRNAENCIYVDLDNGDTEQAELLIGADGIHSVVRQQMLPGDRIRVSGHTTYRSVIPAENMPESLRWNAATLWAGDKCHLVHYPLSDWKRFNLVITCQNGAVTPVSGAPVCRAEVESGFTHIDRSAKQIIRLAEDWKQWVLCDRDPVEQWQDGRAVLLGDAAHPMLQYMAQGACMAIEDACCIANTIEKSGISPSALHAYAEQRIPRTTRVQIASRLIGDHIYHPRGAHAKARDLVLQSWSERDFYYRLDWLYGYDPVRLPSAVGTDS